MQISNYLQYILIHPDLPIGYKNLASAFSDSGREQEAAVVRAAMKSLFGQENALDETDCNQERRSQT